MLRALVHRGDFQRLMAVRPSSRSAHFALHYVAGRPHRAGAIWAMASAGELSTDSDEHLAEPVEKTSRPIWLGMVVPKRQVRRAVMRNLLKRQIRGAFERHQRLLADGLWLVRVRQGFGPADFASASSRQLREVVRQELDTLLGPAERVAAARPTASCRPDSPRGPASRQPR